MIQRQPCLNGCACAVWPIVIMLSFCYGDRGKGCETQINPINDQILKFLLYRENKRHKMEGNVQNCFLQQ